MEVPIAFPPKDEVTLTEAQLAGIKEEVRRLKSCSNCETELTSAELRMHTGLCFHCIRLKNQRDKENHLKALAGMSFEERLAILEEFQYNSKMKKG